MSVLIISICLWRLGSNPFLFYFRERYSSDGRDLFSYGHTHTHTHTHVERNCNFAKSDLQKISPLPLPFWVENSGFRFRFSFQVGFLFLKKATRIIIFFFGLHFLDNGCDGGVIMIYTVTIMSVSFKLFSLFSLFCQKDILYSCKVYK